MNWRNSRKAEADFVNVITNEIYDFLILVICSLVNNWVLDLDTLFHTIPHQEIF